MPKSVIERELPGAGKLSTDELKAVAMKSCGVPANRVSEVMRMIDPTTAE